ncbi:EF hand [Blastochloris viridis]|uniref:EF hand n=2 Tax=Blastochloris viridis TaxID=1079 RepID=A0A0P0IHD9_BLAVI|nr:EF hand [Blastochloris viridis]CUU43159.1 EF hand [Blastochloris viridis]
MSISAVSSSSATQSLQSILAKVDGDQSGSVSLDEMLQATEGSNLDQSTVTSVFANADSDSNGELSATEFQTLFSSMSTETRGELLTVQEESSDVVEVAEALAGYAAAAGENSQAGASSGSSGSGGGAGGAGGASSESTDPADLNGDGRVTAAEQAIYDATHAVSSTETSSPEVSSATTLAGATLDLAA